MRITDCELCARLRYPETCHKHTEPNFITQSRLIVKTWQCATLHRDTGKRVHDKHKFGILVDAQTADRMVQVYDKLSASDKCAKTEKIGLVKFAQWVWKL